MYVFGCAARTPFMAPFEVRIDVEVGGAASSECHGTWWVSLVGWVSRARTVTAGTRHYTEAGARLCAPGEGLSFERDATVPLYRRRISRAR